VLAEASPTLIGWRSLQDESRAVMGDPDPFHHDSRRFEVATSCIPLMAGLRTSLELLEQQGSAERRLEQIQALSAKLWQQLATLPGATPLLEGPPPAGLVSFTLTAASPPSQVVQALGAEGIWIRDLADPACLRACTHITSTDEELLQLQEALAELLRV
jgi:L-cysteine/cystine lyase